MIGSSVCRRLMHNFDAEPLDDMRKVKGWGYTCNEYTNGEWIKVAGRAVYRRQKAPDEKVTWGLSDSSYVPLVTLVKEPSETDICRRIQIISRREWGIDYYILLKQEEHKESEGLIYIPYDLYINDEILLALQALSLPSDRKMTWAEKGREIFLTIFRK